MTTQIFLKVPDQKTYFSSNFKLGILGGGQLGKMLLTETRRYDIHTKVMDASPSAPCRIGSNEFINASITDKDSVLDFAKDCDLLTIEIENVSTKALHQLEEQGLKVFPKPDTLDIIRNKVDQKKFYTEHNIPTASYFSFENSIERDAELAKEHFKPPFVWKAATGGYDGRGVSIIHENEDLEEVGDFQGLIEQKIDFAAEVAVVTARSANGEIKSFPMVEMEFHPTANFVEFVFCPSAIADNFQLKATKLAEEVAEKMGHVGLLAVEMFLTNEGEILVNEVAPRVHNSGHLTIEGNNTSQFDQHLRAILALPLGDTSIRKPSVMINLTGEEGFSGPVIYDGIEKVMTMPGTYVHLYGKAETRPFRKMGHVTITADTVEEAKTKAREVQKTIKVISK